MSQKHLVKKSSGVLAEIREVSLQTTTNSRKHMHCKLFLVSIQSTSLFKTRNLSILVRLLQNGLKLKTVSSTITTALVRNRFTKWQRITATTAPTQTELFAQHWARLNPICESVNHHSNTIKDDRQCTF